MRTARVFYLFLSVLQFIFFLKLVEYVRGEEIGTGKHQLEAAAIPHSPVSTEDEKARGMFIAPNIQRKKPRRWNQGKSSNLSQIESLKTDEAGAKAGNVADVGGAVLNGDSETDSQNKRKQYEQEVARLCPACQNNECGGIPISAGFPVVPVIIAVIVGVAWFILFLILWIFHTRPDKHQSGGYGSGYGSPQPEYGDDDSEKPSIFDHFLKPNDRSLRSFTKLTHNVLDSIGKLSDLYNSY